MVQAGVTGDLPTDAFTLIAQHCAHAFQLANDPVDFLHRIGGDALEQRIRVFGGRVISTVSLAVLQARECDVFDIASFFRCAPLRRSEFLRAGFLWTKLVRTKPLDDCHRLTPYTGATLR